jgi:hypothetical protein
MSGPFIITNVDSSDAGTVTAPIFLSSLTIMKTAAGTATITVWVTETGLTGGALTNFMSTLTAIFVSTGGTVDETTSYTGGNALWGTGVTLTSQDFAADTNVQTRNQTKAVRTENPYSLTEQFAITATMPGQVRLSEQIIAAQEVGVPEAPAWAMMLLGLAGLGCAGLRRARGARLASV